MSELLQQLGIDGRLLVAQIVNFAILVFVLHRFAYRPLVDALERRRERIEQSLKHAQAIEDERAQLAQERQRIIGQAHQEAQALVDRARHNAEVLHKRLTEEAKQQAESIRTTAAAEAAVLRQRVVSEAREQLADLVLNASERVIEKRLTSEDDRRLVEKTLRQLNQ